METAEGYKEAAQANRKSCKAAERKAKKEQEELAMALKQAQLDFEASEKVRLAATQPLTTSTPTKKSVGGYVIPKVNPKPQTTEEGKTCSSTTDTPKTSEESTKADSQTATPEGGKKKKTRVKQPKKLPPKSENVI